jgi:uncharacterized protein YkwD
VFLPIVIVFLLVLAGCTPVVMTPRDQVGASGSTPVASSETAVRDFVQLLNDQRRKAGCAPLVWHDGAAAVAAAHSSDMQRRGYFSHDTPEGRSPFDRLRAAGLSYVAAAENIGQGPRTGPEAFTLWMNSAGHRGNMLNCAYTHHGVAMAGQYWTHVFVTPR